MLTRPKHSRVRLPTPKPSGHDLIGSFTAHLVEEMPGDAGMSGGRLIHELFVPSLATCKDSKLIGQQYRIAHLCRASGLMDRLAFPGDKLKVRPLLSASSHASSLGLLGSCGHARTQRFASLEG